MKCPVKCGECQVFHEKKVFNRKNHDFPNGDRNAELQFRTLAEKIEACENRINEWRNGFPSGLKPLTPELRDVIASVVIRVLKQRPPMPLKYTDYQNLEQLRADPESLSRVAQFFEIEPKKLRKLL